MSTGMNNLLGNMPDLDDTDSEEEFEDEHDVSKSQRSSKDDVESQEEEVDENSHYMQYFFKEVDGINADIKAISQASKDIEEIHEEAMVATTTEEEQKLSQKLAPIINGTNKKAKRSKTLLGLLKEETDKLKAEGTLNASNVRVRENMITTLTKKFVDEMKIYQRAQQDYKTDIKNKVKRQIHVVKPDATDEEIDDIMKSDGGRDAFYKQSMLAGGVNDEIQTTYSKVAGKYQDVLTLETSVAELHQMFLDFALLTEQQGELLDQIEFNVAGAADHVEEANVEVVQAIDYQKQIRKKQLTIILIVAAVGAVLVFIIL